MTTEKKSSKSFTQPTDEEIAIYAYYLWEQEGCPQGRDMEHWLQAKAHLIADRQHDAGLLARSTQRAIVQKQPTSAESDEAKAKKKKTETPRIAPARQAAFA